jgi:hypothetical protein
VFRQILAAVAVVVVCSAGWIGVRTEHRNAKDRRDLLELTSSSPWSRTDLIVPDGLPPGGRALGWLDRTGLDVAFDLAADGRKVPVKWQLHHPEPDGTLTDAVDCAATATVTCTDLGDGFTFAVSKQAQNSIPSTALLRSGGDRVLSVTVQTPEYVRADALRSVLTRTHHPTDAELLDLLRHDGHQTDWS